MNSNLMVYAILSLCTGTLVYILSSKVIFLILGLLVGILLFIFSSKG